MPQKPIVPEESFVDMEFPFHGLELSQSFSEQRPQTTRQGVNVRTFEAQTQRGRGGSRPGISQFIHQQLPSGPHLVQHLNFVVDPSANALLDEYDFDGDYVVDPSNLGRGLGRRIRRGGSGRKPSRNRKKTPLISWVDPADITVGTALDSTQLNAAAFDPVTLASVSGSFAYLPPSGTVLPEGEDRPLKTTFTPSSPNLYRTATATVHIDVIGSDIEFVQKKQASTLGLSSVLFDADVGADSTIIVYVMSFGANDPTVTDSQANTYTQVGSSVTSGSYRLTQWRTVASAGALTVDYLCSDQTNAYAVVLEYSGVKTSSPVDGTSTNTEVPPDDSWTTGTVTVSVAGELLLGAFFDDATHSAVDHLTGAAGFTKRIAQIGLPVFGGGGGISVGSFWLFEQIGPGVGSPAVTATLDSGNEPGRYLAIGSSLKPQ